MRIETSRKDPERLHQDYWCTVRSVPERWLRSRAGRSIFVFVAEFVQFALWPPENRLRKSSGSIPKPWLRQKRSFYRSPPICCFRSGDRPSSPPGIRKSISAVWDTNFQKDPVLQGIPHGWMAVYPLIAMKLFPWSNNTVGRSFG